MIKKCAWCQKALNEKSQEEILERPISHGICSECAEKMLQELETTAKNFLDGFPQPIMLVDNLNNVLITNKAAKLATRADFDFNSDYRCGTIIGCIHSELPGGCGATIHCEGCVIRRSILETDRTGKACREVACTDKKFYCGELVANMVISTEKFGDRILLRIDPIKDDDKDEGNDKE